MLLVLMYHQIFNPTHHAFAELFEMHVNYLHANYPIIRPGEQLKKNTLNICLTFDDAYYDFYYYIYPLVKQLGIPVVLGIPTKFIQNTSTTAPRNRLAVQYPLGLEQNMQHLSPLCSWEEIQEMVGSGLVHIASHGHTHIDLTTSGLDIAAEFQTSKNLLEKKLNLNVDTVIYPFGKTSKYINQVALQYFKYAMRIGSALNTDWQSRNGLIYRINADDFWRENKYFSNIFLLQAKLKYFLNYLRNK